MHILIATLLVLSACAAGALLCVERARYHHGESVEPWRLHVPGWSAWALAVVAYLLDEQMGLTTGMLGVLAGLTELAFTWKNQDNPLQRRDFGAIFFASTMIAIGLLLIFGSAQLS